MNTLTDTTTTELLPLFEQWAEMESDRCRVNVYNEPKQFDVLIDLGDGWTTVWASIFGDISKTSLALVQASLQEAIAARDLSAEISISGSRTQALILSIDGLMVIEQHDQAAIALLQCYIQALKAARAAS